MIRDPVIRRVEEVLRMVRAERDNERSIIEHFSPGYPETHRAIRRADHARLAQAVTLMEGALVALKTLTATTTKEPQA